MPLTASGLCLVIGVLRRAGLLSQENKIDNMATLNNEAKAI